MKTDFLRIDSSAVNDQNAARLQRHDRFSIRDEDLFIGLCQLKADQLCLRACRGGIGSSGVKTFLHDGIIGAAFVDFVDDLRFHPFFLKITQFAFFRCIALLLVGEHIPRSVEVIGRLGGIDEFIKGFNRCSDRERGNGNTGWCGSGIGSGGG